MNYEHRMNGVDFTNLRSAATETTPVDADWERLNLDEDWTYVEAFEYEADDQTYTLITTGPSVTHIVIDGSPIDLNSYTDYLDAVGVDDDDESGLPDGILSEDEFAALAQVEPYQYGADGPMMSYWYPFDLWGMSDQDAAAAIAHLPLCLVRVDNQPGLALTGGGMDLSWEICEAFLQLGYLPPLHFVDLPLMAGRAQSEADRRILAGCIMTCTRVSERALATAERLASKFNLQVKP